MVASTELVWQRVSWPVPMSSSRALELIRRLASDTFRLPVIFETRCHEGEVSHAVGTAAHQVRELTQLLESFFPSVLLSKLKQPRTMFAKSTRLVVSRPALPLNTEQAGNAARTVLSSLAAAHYKTEEATLQVVLGQGRPPRPSLNRPADPTQSLVSTLTRGIRPADSQMAKRLQAKNSEPTMEVVVRAAVDAKSEGRQVSILRGILAALRTLQSPGTRLDFVAESPARVAAATGSRGSRLSSSEILSLVGWPLDDDSLPGMPPAHPKPSPLRVRNEETKRVFAATNTPDERRPIGIGIEDALFHTVILGPTGSGKSSLVLRLALEDIRAGRSVVVIDPKKDLVEDMLERIPENRRGDVVVLDPTDSDYPVGLNPLVVPGTPPELIADGVLGTFRDLFPHAFGPQVSDVIHASVLTLAVQGNGTLPQLVSLLSDPRQRAKFVAKVKDEALLGFWEQYEGLSERQRSQQIAPVLSRLRQFLARPTLRRTLDQAAPRFQLTELFATPKVLLVPINSGLLGNEAARLFGSLLVSQLTQLTLARADQPREQRSPVSVYIDEAAEYVRLGGELPDMLARSRSLGVAWHLSFQHRTQMSPDMRSAIDANARNKITFAVGAEDARALSAMTSELVAEDFMSLPTYAIYASLMREGNQLPWVSGRTLPPPPKISDPLDLIARSRARYGQIQPDNSPNPESIPPEETIGRRRRSS